MPALGICPVNPLQETSQPLCCPFRSNWRGQQTCRVKRSVKPLTASKLLHHLRCVPDQLACECSGQLFSVVDTSSDIFPNCSCVDMNKATPVSVTVCSSGSKFPTVTERRQLERSPLSQQAAQERAPTATHIPVPTCMPPLSTAEATAKGSNSYKLP